MRVIKIFDEVAAMSDLQSKTIGLIHATSLIPAMKKLMAAYEIIDINLQIERNYIDYKDFPPWDIPALTDLNQIRRELIVYHRKDFEPIFLLDRYSNKMSQLFHNIKKTRENLAAVGF